MQQVLWGLCLHNLACVRVSYEQLIALRKASPIVPDRLPFLEADQALYALHMNLDSAYINVCSARIENTSMRLVNININNVH